MRKFFFLLVAIVAVPVAAQDPDYVFRVEDSSAMPGAMLSPRVLLDNSGGDIQGFSFSFNNAEGLLEPISIDCGPALEALNGGDGPDVFFVTPEDDPTLGTGFTMGTAFSLLGTEFLFPGTDYHILTLNFEVPVLASTGTTVVGTCGCLGSPPLEDTVVVLGQSIVPTIESGEMTISDFLFIRGDTNQDLAVNIADAIYLLNFLFVPGSDQVCLTSHDVNSDDTANIADAIYLLNFLFVPGSPSPEAPFPACGVAPSMFPCDAPAC